jgi:hypothetical protein
MTLMPFELVIMLKDLIACIERGDPQEIADLTLRYKKWVASHEESNHAN